MGKKIVSIVGATGVQGGSILKTFLGDDDFKVRAITRNSRSVRSQALADLGADLAQANLNDALSLQKAFEGSHIIFGTTNFFEPFNMLGPNKAVDIEVQQGLNLADAAQATPTLEQYIWSTLPNSRRLSDGKHVVPHFDSKNRVDDYIKSQKSLIEKTTFLWITFYPENYTLPMYSPFTIPTASLDTYIQLQATPSSVLMKLIGNTEINIGRFVKAIIRQPEKTLGKVVLAYLEDMTSGELLSTWAKALGKRAYYIQVDKETYYSLWPVWAEEMGKMQKFWEYTSEKSWTGEKQILKKTDLGVTGLVATAEICEDGGLGLIWLEFVT